ERIGREAGAARTVSAHRRLPARRRAAHRAGRPPLAPHGGRLAKSSAPILTPSEIRVVALDLPTSWDAGGSGRRLHRAHVPGAQFDDARYARRYRPQAL